MTRSKCIRTEFPYPSAAIASFRGGPPGADSYQNSQPSRTGVWLSQARGGTNARSDRTEQEASWAGKRKDSCFQVVVSGSLLAD